MRVAQNEELVRTYREVCNNGQDWCIFSGDFENATDNLEHEVAYMAVSSFLREVGVLSPYMDLALRILLSPRRVVDKNETWISKRGILMGEPLTKAVLTILGFIASKSVASLSESTALSGWGKVSANPRNNFY